MSLTKCKECGLIVSSEAETCPHCGVKLRKSAWRAMWTILSIILCIVILGLLYQTPFSPVLKPNKAEEWIRAEADKYAKKSFEGTMIVYKSMLVEKEPSSEDYKATVVVDVLDLKDRILILEIEKSADGYIYKWDQEAWDILSGEIIKEQIKADAEKFAKESFEGTEIVYKKIGGVRKESLSEDDYTVVVVVDIPDHNDRILILEIKGFEDNYTIGWDTRSAAVLTLLGMDEAIRQITQ